MKVKFCGLTRPEDIAVVNQLKPDYIGFVFAPSPRQVTPEQAAGLWRDLEPSIQSVGVFVDAGVSAMVEAVKTVGLNVIQLHGNEDDATILQLRALVPDIQIWRALRLKDATVLEQNHNSPADLLLIDAFTQEAAGGTGKTANWDLLAANRPVRPFLLAGGLNASNIEEAISTIRPWGVDISSGIETGGKKDPDKMRNMIHLIQHIKGELK